MIRFKDLSGPLRVVVVAVYAVLALYVIGFIYGVVSYAGGGAP